jgi:hypothetical protein
MVLWGMPSTSNFLEQTKQPASRKKGCDLWSPLSLLMRILKVLLWQKGQHKTTNLAVWWLSQQRPLPQQVFAMLLKTTVSTAAKSSCVFDMNSSVSSSTDVGHTTSPLAGSPRDVDVVDWAWPVVPIPQSTQPYPKAPESKETIMRRKTGKF